MFVWYWTLSQLTAAGVADVCHHLWNIVRLLQFPEKRFEFHFAISHSTGAIHEEEEDSHWTVANLRQVNIHSRAALDTWKCQLEEMMLFANTICFAMFCISCCERFMFWCSFSQRGARERVQNVFYINLPPRLYWVLIIIYGWAELPRLTLQQSEEGGHWPSCSSECVQNLRIDRWPIGAKHEMRHKILIIPNERYCDCNFIDCINWFFGYSFSSPFTNGRKLNAATAIGVLLFPTIECLQILIWCNKISTKTNRN